jgi:hypothetical protein
MFRFLLISVGITNNTVIFKYYWLYFIHVEGLILPYSDPKKQKEAMRKIMVNRRLREKGKVDAINLAISEFLTQTGIGEEVKLAYEQSKHNNWLTEKYEKEPLVVLAYFQIAELRNNVFTIIDVEKNLPEFPDRAKCLVKKISEFLFNFNLLPAYEKRLETIVEIAYFNNQLGVQHNFSKVVYAENSLVNWLSDLLEAFKGTYGFEKTETSKKIAISANKDLRDYLNKRGQYSLNREPTPEQIEAAKKRFGKMLEKNSNEEVTKK